MRSVLACAVVAALLFVGASAARAEKVDVALVLAADVSRSIDDDEFKLQRQGYAAAITNPRVLARHRRPAPSARSPSASSNGRGRRSSR